MGRYMTVVLKEYYRNDIFINHLNKDLSDNYGANQGIKFNTLDYLQEEANYMNTNPEGLKQVPHWQRPITAELLHKNCHWLRFAEYSFKLSAPESAELAINAIAVCKWIIRTKTKYILKRLSENYTIDIVRQYLDFLFEESGHDLNKLWEDYYTYPESRK